MAQWRGRRCSAHLAAAQRLDQSLSLRGHTRDGGGVVAEWPAAQHPRDPYVTQGLVTRWAVRPWAVVIGADASDPATAGGTP